MYAKIKGYFDEFIEYFPEYEENPEYIPPKKFIWDIFWTIDSELANRFIAHSLKERNQENKDGDKTIEVSEDVLNQLHSANYFSKKKGKALFMLTASKELGSIKRKRKKSFKVFEPSNEEVKKDRTKRGKHKEDEANSKITNWLIPKKSKVKEKEATQSKDSKQKTSEEDNIDMDIETLRISNPFTKK